MGVIQLNSDLVGEGIEISSVMLPRAEFARLVTADDVLQRGRDHEVLLLQTQLLTLEEVIVGVEYPGNVLREVPIDHSLNVVSVVD